MNQETIGGRAIQSAVHGTRATEHRQRVDLRLPSVVVSAIWLIAVLAVSAGILTSRWGGASDPPTALFQGLGTLVAATVGAVLATRLPANPIGWLFLLTGVTAGIGLGARDVADYGLVAHPGSVPGAIWLAWLSDWNESPGLTITVWLCPLLFPSGTLPSPRWRAPLAVGIAFMIATTVESALSPVAGSQSPTSVPSALVLASVPSPLVLNGTAGDVLGGVASATAVLGVVTLPLIGWSLVQRYRQGSMIERQQLKWFLAVLVVIALALVVALILGGTHAGILADISKAAWLVVLVSTALLPVAIGIAVLRYRLYEIDRLVSRGVSYGALTVLLTGLFVALVLVKEARAATRRSPVQPGALRRRARLGRAWHATARRG